MCFSRTDIDYRRLLRHLHQLFPDCKGSRSVCTLIPPHALFAEIEPVPKRPTVASPSPLDLRSDGRTTPLTESSSLLRNRHPLTESMPVERSLSINSDQSVRVFFAYVFIHVHEQIVESAASPADKLQMFAQTVSAEVRVWRLNIGANEIMFRFQIEKVGHFYDQQEAQVVGDCQALLVRSHPCACFGCLCALM